MRHRSNALWVGAVAVLFSSVLNPVQAQQPDSAGQADDKVYDKVVNDFIRFDIGQIRDPFAVEQIKARFNALRSDDAVPALVRGLNASTRMRASCPITALSTKLRGVLNASKNPEVGTFVLQNLERNNVGQYTHYVNTIFDVAEAQVARTMGKGLAEQRFKQRAQAELLRLAHTPGLKLTDLAPRDPADLSESDDSREKTRGQTKRTTGSGAARSSRLQSGGTSAESALPGGVVDLSKLSVGELTDRLTDRAVQVKVLAELARRASAGEEQKVADGSAAIVRCLAEGEDAARESAARLLGLIRCQHAVEPLIEALEDSNPKVRSAAVTSLTRITRQLFGPSDDATPEERHIAQTRWRDWWARQTKSPQ